MPHNKAARVKRFARKQNGRRDLVPNLLLFCCYWVDLRDRSTSGVVDYTETQFSVASYNTHKGPEPSRNLQ
jgi:hypothetical protein